MDKQADIICTFRQSLYNLVWGHSLSKWFILCHKYMFKKTEIGMTNVSFIIKGFNKSRWGKKGGIRVSIIQYVNIINPRKSVRCKVGPLRLNNRLKNLKNMYFQVQNTTFQETQNGLWVTVYKWWGHDMFYQGSGIFKGT